MRNRKIATKIFAVLIALAVVALMSLLDDDWFVYAGSGFTGLFLYGWVKRIDTPKDVLPTVDDLERLGFVMFDNLLVEKRILDIGRGRSLSLTDQGTPNEMIWITQANKEDNREIEDLVCVHNYDFDKYITLHRLEQLVNGLKA